MRHIIQSDLTILARQLEALEENASTYLRITKDDLFARNDLLAMGPGGEHVLQAIGRISQDLPDAFTPIILSSDKADRFMTVAGAPIDIETMSSVLDSLAMAHDIISKDDACTSAVNGGDHRYLIGSDSTNLTLTARTIDADTAQAAVIKYIAGRVPLGDVDFISPDLDFRQAGEFSIRRAHDWKSYDFDALVEHACNRINLALEDKIDDARMPTPDF